MSASRLGKQISFLREIEKLKGVLRVNRTVDGRFENSAEHSWHVALMALLLEEHASNRIDMLRVVKLLLIHDLVEIDAGDTWLYETDQDSKAEAEKQAAYRLYSLLPESQKDEYIKLWDEFETRSSEEAKFASVIDGIQPLLNHVVTGKIEDGVIPLEKVRSKKAYISQFSPKLWVLVEELIEESVNKGLYE
ncbi:MAG: HD domain-containing protein [Gammaproteobacteria bacterium]|nr:HD domain-containing protein [Gammaproteobacteria bacterium]